MAIEPTSPSTQGRGRRPSFRVETLLALLVIVVVGPIVHEYRAQQASRYVLTAAIWEDQSIHIDRYAAADPPVLGIDRAVRDGHTYSDKAPLQPVLAVPFYAAYRAVGGESAIRQRLDENLGLWWITLWMSTIPAAVLAALMYRVGRRFSAEDSLVATVALFFGSMLLPFAVLLFGHELAALCLFAAFALLMAPRLSPGHLVGAGALAGAGVAAEYTAGLAVFVLAGLALWRVRAKALWYVIGGVPAALGLAWYHTVAFGSPLAHPYRYSAFNEVTEQARGFFEIFSRLHVDHLAAVFVDGRGFLFASPMVVLGLVGLVFVIRSDSGERVAFAWTALAMFMAFLMIPLFWGNPWGGDSPGSRYMTPALPFLVIGAAAIWRRAGLWSRVAAVVGMLTMGLAIVTDPLLSRDGGSVGSWVRFAADGDIVPTVFTIAIGPLGWVLHLGLVLIVGRALFLANRADVESNPARV